MPPRAIPKDTKTDYALKRTKDTNSRLPVPSSARGSGGKSNERKTKSSPAQKTSLPNLTSPRGTRKESKKQTPGKGKVLPETPRLGRGKVNILFRSFYYFHLTSFPILTLYVYMIYNIGSEELTQTSTTQGRSIWS